MSYPDYDQLLNQITSGDQNETSRSGRMHGSQRVHETRGDVRGESRSETRGEARSERRRQTDKSSDSSEEEFSSTIEREGINYYAVLGVEAGADTKTIKRAYNRRLRKYHPDNLKDKSDQDTVRKNKEKYKLINEAYSVLKDEFKRRAYDTNRKHERSNSKSFNDAKGEFKEFIKLQNQNMTDEDKKMAKLNFELSKKELNAKHGYDDSKEEKIDPQEYERRLDDMKLQRDQEELDIQHDNMFEGRQFNHSEFNKRFERQKRRQEKKQKQGDLVVANDDGVMAFNDGVDSSFASVDAYSDLYAGGKYSGTSDMFAGVGDGMIGDDVGSDDISIDSADIEDTYDTHTHANTKEDIDDALSRMMAERNTQDNEFDKMGVNDFGSALDDKYGISKDFGFMVGNDRSGHQTSRRPRRNRNKDNAEYEAYKELTKD